MQMRLISLCGLVAVGCSAQTSNVLEEAPGAETEEAVEETQLITSGAWTAFAHQPGADDPFILGAATFTGPAGQTRRMGVCLLQAHSPSVSCNTTADCNNAPSSLPGGGFRYCTSPNGSGAKRCYFRPGSAGAYCSGTPAHGQPIAAGTYGTPSVLPIQGKQYISYACFEGCVSTDPSSSSTMTSPYKPGQW
jgi:hypothetical protein